VGRYFAWVPAASAQVGRLDRRHGPLVPQISASFEDLTDIFVFEGTERQSGVGKTTGTIVCVLITISGQEFEDGCNTSVPEGSFTVAPDLSSADLDPTTVTLARTECTFDSETGGFICKVVGTRTVTVEAEWTATGALVRSQEKRHSKINHCIDIFMRRGESRQAVATATPDGTSLGASVFAEIRRGMSKVMATCPIF
jgi:hypothetical protein